MMLKIAIGVVFVFLLRSLLTYTIFIDFEEIGLTKSQIASLRGKKPSEVLLVMLCGYHQRGRSELLRPGFDRDDLYSVAIALERAYERKFGEKLGISSNDRNEVLSEFIKKYTR
jgi:hypothetical protein